MSKRQVLILLIAAVLLTTLSVALSRRDSRDWRANRSRRLFPFPWQDTASLVLSRPDGTSQRFEKNARGEWMVRLDDEIADNLNYRAVDEFSALATLTWREAVADAAPPSPDKAVTLVATSAAGQKVSFSFGDLRNNLRATVIDGDDSVVYGVNQDLLNFLDWPERRFRNYYLATAGSGAKPKKIILSPQKKDEDLEVVVERDNEGWNVVRPANWPADAARLDLLLRWVERLRADSIEAEMSGDLEWFGFGPDSPFVEVIYAVPAGDLRRRVEFGKDTGEGKTYARVEGRTPIFAVPNEALAEISMNVAADHPALWRNFYRRRTLTAIGNDLPLSLTIERLLPEPAKLTLEQVRDKDVVKWRGKLESGGQTREFAVDPPDGSDQMRPLTALLTGLSNLRIKTFLADTPPGSDTIKWTAYPAWRFRSRSAEGGTMPVLTLYAADADGGLPPGDPYAEGVAGPLEMTHRAGYPDKVGVAFSLSDRSAVMETFAELGYLLCLPPYRYQSRRMLELDPRWWGKIEVAAVDQNKTYFRQPGEVNEQWWLDPTAPEPLMDDNNRFVAMLAELSQLRSDGFVEDANGDIANFGLDQPEITAIVYTSKERGSSEEGDGRLFKLTVGKVSETAGARYARLNDTGPVFLISGQLAEGLKDIYR